MNWFYQKPADQNPHCFQKRVYIFLQKIRPDLYALAMIMARAISVTPVPPSVLYVRNRRTSAL